MPLEILKTCSRLIAKKGYRVAFVESVTTGRMCAEFSLFEGSGQLLKRGISSYEQPEDEIKEDRETDDQVIQRLKERAEVNHFKEMEGNMEDAW